MRQCFLAVFFASLYILGPFAYSQTPYLKTADFSLNAVLKRLQNASYDYQIALLQTKALKAEGEGLLGAYDTSVNAQLGYRIDASDPVNAVFGTRNDTLSYTANLRKNFKYGTSVEFGFLGSSQSSNSPFVALDPAIDNQWYVKFRQSLWRDGFGKNIIKEIEALDSRADGLEIISERQKELLLASALINIIQLEYNTGEQKILTQAYQRALDLNQNTIKRRRLGVANVSDVLASSANILAREQNVSESKRQYEITCQEILFLLAYDLKEYQCGGNSFSDSFVMHNTGLHSVYRGDHRELKKIEKDILAQKLVVEAFKNRINPDLNLIIELASNGVNENWSESFKESISLENPNFFTGLELSVPLSNRGNKSALKREKIINDQLKLQLKRLKHDIEKNHANAIKNYLSYQNQWQLSIKQVELEEKKLREKNKDFRIGRAEISDVILYQQDVLNAQLRVKRNETQMRIAMIDKLLAEGGLLDSSNIKIKGKDNEVD